MLATELEAVHVLLSVPMLQEANLKQNMTRTAGTSRAGISTSFNCGIIIVGLSLSGTVTATVGAITACGCCYNP